LFTCISDTSNGVGAQRIAHLLRLDDAARSRLQVRHARTLHALSWRQASSTRGMFRARRDEVTRRLAIEARHARAARGYWLRSAPDVHKTRVGRAPYERCELGASLFDAHDVLDGRARDWWRDGLA
jgi:hypothetical protein